MYNEQNYVTVSSLFPPFYSFYIFLILCCSLNTKSVFVWCLPFVLTVERECVQEVLFAVLKFISQLFVQSSECALSKLLFYCWSRKLTAFFPLCVTAVWCISSSNKPFIIQCKFGLLYITCANPVFTIFQLWKCLCHSSSLGCLHPRLVTTNL